MNKLLWWWQFEHSMIWKQVHVQIYKGAFAKIKTCFFIHTHNVRESFIHRNFCNLLKRNARISSMIFCMSELHNESSILTIQCWFSQNWPTYAKIHTFTLNLCWILHKLHGLLFLSAFLCTILPTFLFPFILLVLTPYYNLYYHSFNSLAHHSELPETLDG